MVADSRFERPPGALPEAVPDAVEEALGEAQFPDSGWDDVEHTAHADADGGSFEAVVEPEQTVMVGAEATTYVPGGEAVADALALGKKQPAGRWEKLLARLIGRPEEVAFEERMAASFALAIGGGAAAGVLASLLLGAGLELVILCAVYAPLGLVIYGALRKQRIPVQWVPPVLLGLTASFVSYYWLRFDGSSGGAPLAALVLALLPAIVARGWRRLLVLGAFGALGGLLFGIELIWPEAVHQRHSGVTVVWPLCFVILGGIVLALSRAHTALVEEVEVAGQRTDLLLANVMPAPVVERLRRGERNIADSLEAVTVIFADIAGFTEASASRRPGQVLALLNQLFTEFDAICQRHGVERIKTIGDAYMAAAGVPTQRPDHAVAAARAALEMMRFATANPGLLLGAGLRMGLHSGPAVGGVVGSARFAYDLWGDAVNLASRMESHGVVGQIQVSRDTARLLGDDFELQARGEIEVKGRGRVETFFVLRELDSAEP